MMPKLLINPKLAEILKKHGIAYASETCTMTIKTSTPNNAELYLGEYGELLNMALHGVLGAQFQARNHRRTCQDIISVLTQTLVSLLSDQFYAPERLLAVDTNATTGKTILTKQNIRIGIPDEKLTGTPRRMTIAEPGPWSQLSVTNVVWQDANPDVPTYVEATSVLTPVFTGVDNSGPKHLNYLNHQTLLCGGSEPVIEALANAVYECASAIAFEDE